MVKLKDENFRGTSKCDIRGIMGQREMQVLILGAGLSGLVAAIGFRKAGHGVVVLEKAPELREIGDMTSFCL